MAICDIPKLHGTWGLCCVLGIPGCIYGRKCLCEDAIPLEMRNDARASLARSDLGIAPARGNYSNILLRFMSFVCKSVQRKCLHNMHCTQFNHLCRLLTILRFIAIFHSFRVIALFLEPCSINAAYLTLVAEETFEDGPKRKRSCRPNSRPFWPESKRKLG